MRTGSSVGAGEVTSYGQASRSDVLRSAGAVGEQAFESSGRMGFEQQTLVAHLIRTRLIPSLVETRAVPPPASMTTLPSTIPSPVASAVTVPVLRSSRLKPVLSTERTAV